jgi:hypothetical protein
MYAHLCIMIVEEAIIYNLEIQTNYVCSHFSMMGGWRFESADDRPFLASLLRCSRNGAKVAIDSLVVKSDLEYIFRTSCWLSTTSRMSVFRYS